jgi:Eco57I restriction-modification methylase
MALQSARARDLLVKGDLRALFVEELGWDRHTASLDLLVDSAAVAVRAIAQKRGMVAYHCPTRSGQRLPDYTLRRKIEHLVAKAAHEHLIVFTDAANETQIWQWVKREPGKPAACREHTFHRSQPGDALLQKLEGIAFTLAEEERLALTDVTRRARAAFDVERVTKRFYERFQKEHAAFLKFITGITETTDREWYASVMLNRLMFVYFIQRKGFLDGDREYLRNRLKQMRAQYGRDKFYSFYRYFLLRLFHEGLGGRKRTPELEKLVGRIPFLNGGLFDVHELEKADTYAKTIQIRDEAFERIFDYFDQYQWHLDERPLRADNEINPDVLGYIFEKYVNQKQMGAYYTKEDITEYICKNTILPFLLEVARAKCKVAFENPRGPTVWDLLKADSDRYIHPAARHGVDKPLPAEIATGLAPGSLHEPVKDSEVLTLELRKGWNKPAPPDYALPTETWREVIARRTGYEEVRAKLVAGEVRDADTLVTLNLDIRQFVQDAIENCEGPDLLRAFWHAIEKVTILDPTCGSGAFLFAALNILEPLYEACLDRMEAFLEDHLARSDVQHRPEKFSDFREVLERGAAHPNHRYFVLKSIILNNLFGVDIMEEAVEICKLRLFLKLAAQVDPDTAKPNLGIEPLPDIDFNIRAGNTLVGYATLSEVERALMGKFDFVNAAEKIGVKAAELQDAFNAFRARQVAGDGSVPGEDKPELRRRLRALDDELNRYLASEHGIAASKRDLYANWLKSHQPFHWFVEFHGIVSGGGFDVVIGNPPFVEYSAKSFPYPIDGQAFRTAPSRNLYAFVFERSKALAKNNGRVGLIVQISAVSTPSMETMVREIERDAEVSWISNYATRPSCLFDGITMNLSIVLSHIRKSEDAQAPAVFATHYMRWTPEYRPHLFGTVTLVRVDPARLLFPFAIPKLTVEAENGLLAKVAGQQHRIAHFLEASKRKTGQEIYYRTAGGRYYKVFSDRAFGSESKSNKSKSFARDCDRYVMIAVLSSDIWWWYYTLHFDMYNCKDYMMFGFPFDYNACSHRRALAQLGKALANDLFRNAVRKVQKYESTGKRLQLIFRPSASKPIIEKIDHLLAAHYRLTEEELDFIVNYDIKYRMGEDSGEAEEE